jgi:hypothetical protein
MAPEGASDSVFAGALLELLLPPQAAREAAMNADTATARVVFQNFFITCYLLYDK